MSSPVTTPDFDVNAWENGANNHAQGEDFDINKWEGGKQATAQPSAPAAITNGRVLDSYKSATQQGLDNVVQSGKNFVKSLPAALNPVPQTKTETGLALAGLPAPVTRMVGGILSALGDAPAAAKGVMEAPDKVGFLAQPLSQTAADLGVQAAAGAAVESAPEAAGAVGKVVKQAAKPENIGMAVGGYVGHHLGEGLGGAFVGREIGKAVGRAIGDRASGAPVRPTPEAASPESASPAKPQSPAESSPSSQVTTDPDAIQAKLRDILGKNKQPKGKAPAVDAEAMKDRLASLENPTDADTLRSRLDELKNPQLTAQEMRDRLDEITNVHDAATLKARAVPPGEAGFVHQAALQAGPDATIKDVANAAQELKGQSDDFEKTFGQPLENYRNGDGTFNMRDFLNEVVKPGTEPPAHVISRVFGSDGVKLVQDVSGKPIEKWQTSAPTGAKINAEPQGGAARLKAKQANPPSTANYDSFDRVVGRNVSNMSTDSIKKAYDSVASHVTATPRLLGIGNESTVLDVGDKVVKVANEKGAAAPVPNNPDILQPIAERMIDGRRVQVMPKIHTGDVTNAEITAINNRLAKAGYTGLDTAEGNFGRTAEGKPVLIDAGGLKKK